MKFIWKQWDSSINFEFFGWVLIAKEILNAFFWLDMCNIAKATKEIDTTRYEITAGSAMKLFYIETKRDAGFVDGNIQWMLIVIQKWKKCVLLRIFGQVKTIKWKKSSQSHSQSFSHARIPPIK